MQTLGMILIKAFLRAGGEKARSVARPFLQEIRRAVGINSLNS
jgi:hypothetical protein|tara:strand:- start:98 stop:226 length:129 start_codon:yes stop_codon:yes gene_type:complete